MSYDDELRIQSGRARMLIAWGIRQKLRLVRVEYVDTAPRVSIIGHVISEGAVDVWRSMGAAVQTIEELTK